MKVVRVVSDSPLGPEGCAQVDIPVSSQEEFHFDTVVSTDLSPTSENRGDQPLLHREGVGRREK